MRSNIITPIITAAIFLIAGVYLGYQEQQEQHRTAITYGCAQYNPQVGNFEWIDHSHDEENRKKQEAKANSILLNAAGQALPEEAEKPLPIPTHKPQNIPPQVLPSTTTHL